jgi:aspartate/methionine/tyrosine aminotransferase
MTGWRLGYLGAPAHLIDSLLRIRQYTTLCAPTLSQHAAVRAVGSDLHEPMVEAFAARRERVLERLADVPGMEAPMPGGALYAFPTLPAGVDDGWPFVRSLLEDTGVALVPGSVFGAVGEGRVRIAYSNSIDRIDEAFDRLEAWLDDR